MPQEFIRVKGAREHNLKNIDVTLPRDKLVVITGVSGSGKSSLAFDTIYAEGQRRYVESLSAYARQFLGRMDKPDVEYIEGLSPAISIDQRGVSKNPRSTVGTVTEVYDYLRLLFARVGHPHCPKCGRLVERQTVQQIVDAILTLPQDSRIMVMAPKVRRRKGEHKEVFEEARKSGFVRVRANGTIHNLEDMGDLALDKKKWHYIEIVVDRLVVGEGLELNRVADSVETALKHGSGVVLVDVQDGDEMMFSEQFACVHCGTGLPEIEPRTFSFNSPSWRLHCLHRSGLQAGSRPRPCHTEQRPYACRRRHSALGAIRLLQWMVQEPHRVCGGRLRLLRQDSGEGSSRICSERGAVRKQRRIRDHAPQDSRGP